MLQIWRRAGRRSASGWLTTGPSTRCTEIADKTSSSPPLRLPGTSERTLYRKQFICMCLAQSRIANKFFFFYFKGGRSERLVQRGARLHLRRQQPIPGHRTLHAGGVGHVQQGGLRRRHLQRLAGTVLQLRLQLLSNVRILNKKGDEKNHAIFSTFWV